MNFLKDYLRRAFKAFFTKNFVLFLLFSGFAALVNIATRVLFHHLTSIYILSIVLAYLCGMTTAYLLNKFFNFKSTDKKTHYEIANFVFINFIGVLQTILVSVFLAEWLLPSLGIHQYRYLAGHIVGTGAPVFTSFLGHKYITFGKYDIRKIHRYFRKIFKKAERKT